MVREFICTYSQRGLVIIISDFLDDNGCERALQYLSDFGHELMLLQIWADEDRDAAVDRRTGTARRRNRRRASSWISTTMRAQRYTRAFDEYCARSQTLALRSGGRYAGISTSNRWKT